MPDGLNILGEPPTDVSPLGEPPADVSPLGEAPTDVAPLGEAPMDVSPLGGPPTDVSPLGEPPQPGGGEPPKWAQYARTALSAFEPLMAPGDFLRAAYYDLLLRKPGEDSELGKFWRELPKYAPFGDQPEPTKSFAAMLNERRPDLPEWFNNTLGFVMDLAFDPLVFADVLERGGYKIAGKALEKYGIKGADKFMRGMSAADLLEFSKVAPEPIRKQIVWAAKVKKGGELLTPAGLYKVITPDPIRKTIQKSIQSFLSKDTPFYKMVVAPSGNSGIGLAKRPVSLAEFLLTEPEAYKALTRGTKHEKAVNEIMGQGDILNPFKPGEPLKPGAYQEARTIAGHIKALGVSAVKDYQDIYERALGRSIEAGDPLYGEFSRALADFADETGGTFDPILLTATSDLFKAAANPKKFKEVLSKTIGQNELAFAGKRWGELKQKLSQLAKAYDVPEDKLLQAAEATLKETAAVHAITGYYLSGMHRLDEIVRAKLPEFSKMFNASEDAVYDYAFRTLWLAATEKIPMLKKEQQIFKTIENEWRRRGFDEIYGVNFKDYIKSLDSGYVRRVVPLRDPQFAEGILKQAIEEGVKWYPTTALGSSDFVSAVEKAAGGKAAEKLAAHLAVRGDGIMSLAEISKITGMDTEQVSRLLEELDIMDADVAKALMRSLGDVGRPNIAGFELGKQKWQERSIEKDALYKKLLGYTGLDVRTAAYADAASRSISAQEFLSRSWETLNKEGLLRDVGELTAKNGRLFDSEGVEYLKIPNHPDLWGPLAGQYVPRYVAEPTLKALELGDPGMLQSALTLIRTIALSSPDTTLRNIGSGAVMMRDAGISWAEMARAAREASIAIRRFAKEQDPRVFDSGWKYLNLYGEGTLASDAFEKVSDPLLELAKGKEKNALEKLQQAMQTTKWSPARWFQTSEDVMRLTAYYAIKNRISPELLKLSGITEDEVNKIAAHLANNILFNYAMQPYASRVLKKYGLALFPSFTMFNIGRTAKLIAEKPGVITGAMHTTDLVNMLSSRGDTEEYNRRMQMVHGTWLENTAPVMVKIGGVDYAVPAQPFFPTLSLEPESALTEVATGGIYRPLVSATLALLQGETPSYEKKYGREIISPLDYTPAQKATRVVEYLGRQYSLGPVRRLLNLGEAAYHQYVSRGNNDFYFELYGKEFKPSVKTSLINMLISAKPLNEVYRIRQAMGASYKCDEIRRAGASKAERLSAAGRHADATKVAERALLAYKACLEKTVKQFNLGGER